MITQVSLIFYVASQLTSPNTQSPPIIDRNETYNGFAEQDDPHSSEDESDTSSKIGQDSNDDLDENPVEFHSYSEGAMKFLNDVEDYNDDDRHVHEDNIHIGRILHFTLLSKIRHIL